MATLPPKASTASRIRTSSVATMISSSSEHCRQRSQTCCIKGFPAMRCSGLPGKRVEPQRDGRTPRMWVTGEEMDTLGKGWTSVRQGRACGQERFRKNTRTDGEMRNTAITVPPRPTGAQPIEALFYPLVPGQWSLMASSASSAAQMSSASAWLKMSCARSVSSSFSAWTDRRMLPLRIFPS